MHGIQAEGMPAGEGEKGGKGEAGADGEEAEAGEDGEKEEAGKGGEKGEEGKGGAAGRSRRERRAPNRFTASPSKGPAKLKAEAAGAALPPPSTFQVLSLQGSAQAVISSPASADLHALKPISLESPKGTGAP